MEELIDRIYQAALLPELWPSVLEGIAGIADCAGADLFNVVDQAATQISSPSLAETAHEYLVKDWPQHTDRAERVFQRPLTAFVTDLDVYSADELRKEPVYQDFLIPYALGWAAAAGFQATTGDLIVLDVQRSIQDGPIGRSVLRKLDVLRPHIGRAALLCGRLSATLLNENTAAFEALGLAAAAVSARGRVLSMNARMRALPPDLVRDCPHGLRFNDSTVQSHYLQGLAGLASGSRALIPPIPIASFEPKQIVYLLPLRKAAHDLFVSASALVVLSPVAAKAVLPPDVMERLFGLTRAEARTASEIASGRTPQEVANALNLSRETIRSQLKSIFAKTGTRRQLDLAMLMAAPPLGGAQPS